MRHDLWFPSPVSSDFLESLDNRKIENYCLNLKDQNSGRNLSNLGGWQSNDLDLSTPELQDLFVEIRKKLHVLKTDIGMADNVELDIDNIWININGSNSSNLLHSHPNSLFSGVYYVKCTDEASGNIMFRSPIATHEYHLDDRFFKQDNMLMAHTRCFYHPVESKILFFPSWLYHSVGQNEGNDARISISFNTKLIIFEGKNEQV